ncbi:nuclear transport factor 2 family protein [Spirosoma arcticum]
MKLLLICLFGWLAVACTPTNQSIEPMTTNDIVRTVTDVFVGTDERDWARVGRSFASQVLLDYTSFVGGQATTQTPDQLVTSWRAVLPGFEYTHHQLGNFEVEQTGGQATAFCYGTATHYLPQPDGRNLWTVVGTYNFHLVRSNDTWRVDLMRFNFKYQEGNLDLPRLATQRVRER